MDEDNYEAEEFEEEPSSGSRTRSDAALTSQEQLEEPTTQSTPNAERTDEAGAGAGADTSISLTESHTRDGTSTPLEPDTAATPLLAPALMIDAPNPMSAQPSNTPHRILEMRSKFVETRALSYPPRRHSTENAQLYLSRLPSVSESAGPMDAEDSETSPNPNSLASMAREAVILATEATALTRSSSSPNVRQDSDVDHKPEEQQDTQDNYDDYEDDTTSDDPNDAPVVSDKVLSEINEAPTATAAAAAETADFEKAVRSAGYNEELVPVLTSDQSSSGSTGANEPQTPSIVTTEQTTEKPDAVVETSQVDSANGSSTQDLPSPVEANGYNASDFDAEDDGEQVSVSEPSAEKPFEPPPDHLQQQQPTATKPSDQPSKYENEFEGLPSDRKQSSKPLQSYFSDAEFEDSLYAAASDPVPLLYADTEFEDLRDLQKAPEIVHQLEPETTSTCLLTEPSEPKETQTTHEAHTADILVPVVERESNSGGSAAETPLSSEETKANDLETHQDTLSDQTQQEENISPESLEPSVTAKTPTAHEEEEEDEDTYADDDFVEAKEEEPTTLVEPDTNNTDREIPVPPPVEQRRDSDIDMFDGLDSLLEEAKWLITKQHQEEQASMSPKRDTDADPFADVETGEYQDNSYEEPSQSETLDQQSNCTQTEQVMSEPESIQAPTNEVDGHSVSSMAISDGSVDNQSSEIIESQPHTPHSKDSSLASKPTSTPNRSTAYKPKQSELWKPKQTEKAKPAGAAQKTRAVKAPTKVTKAPATKVDAISSPSKVAQKAAAPVKVVPKATAPQLPKNQHPSRPAASSDNNKPPVEPSNTTCIAPTLVPKAPPLGVTPKLPSSHQSHRKMVSNPGVSPSSTQLRAISSPTKPNAAESEALQMPAASQEPSVLAKKTPVFRQKLRKSPEEQLALLRKQKKLAIRPVKSPKRFRFDTVDKSKREWLYLNMFHHQERDIERFQPFFDQMLPKVANTSDSSSAAAAAAAAYASITNTTGLNTKSHEKPSWVTPKAHDSSLPAYDSILDKYCTTVTSPLIQRQIYRTRQDDLTPQLAYILEKRVIKQWRTSDVDPFGAVSSSYRTPIVHTTNASASSTSASTSPSSKATH